MRAACKDAMTFSKSATRSGRTALGIIPDGAVDVREEDATGGAGAAAAGGAGGGVCCCARSATCPITDATTAAKTNRIKIRLHKRKSHERLEAARGFVLYGVDGLLR